MSLSSSFDMIADMRANSKLFTLDDDVLKAAEDACFRALETGHGWKEAHAHYKSMCSTTTGTIARSFLVCSRSIVLCRMSRRLP